MVAERGGGDNGGSRWQDDDASQELLLGQVLAHGDRFASLTVSEEHFSGPWRTLYKAISDTRAAGEYINVATVGGRLPGMGSTSMIAIDAMDLWINHPCGIPELERNLHESWQRRRCERVGASLTNASRDASLDISEMVLKATEMLSATAAPMGKPRFKLDSIDEILSEVPADDVIDGILRSSTFVLVHSGFGNFKSFLVLDWALSVATGTPWHGRAVRQGAVVYLMTEGGGGIGKRLRAWLMERGLSGDGVPFRVLRCPVNPLDCSEMEALRRQLRDINPLLLIVDTWGQALAAGGGDENDNGDTNTAIIAWRRFAQTRPDMTIIAVHHEGHGALGRSRGAKALEDGADTIIALSRKNDVVTLKNRKHKDGEEFTDIALRRKVVDLGLNRKRKRETSCVLVPTTAPPDAITLAPSAWTALRALMNFGAAGAGWGDWRAQSGLKGTTWDEAVRKLSAAGLVTKDPADGLYTLTGAGREALRNHGTPEGTPDEVKEAA